MCEQCIRQVAEAMNLSEFEAALRMAHMERMRDELRAMDDRQVAMLVMLHNAEPILSASWCVLAEAASRLVGNRVPEPDELSEFMCKMEGTPFALQPDVPNPGHPPINVQVIVVPKEEKEGDES